MWWVVRENNHTYEEDFGPWQGIDYARFSDPPHLSRDTKLQVLLSKEIDHEFSEYKEDFFIQVRNGFVILKSSLPLQELVKLREFIMTFDGVKEVILSRFD